MKVIMDLPLKEMWFDDKEANDVIMKDLTDEELDEVERIYKAEYSFDEPVYKDDLEDFLKNDKDLIAKWLGYKNWKGLMRCERK